VLLVRSRQTPRPHTASRSACIPASALTGTPGVYVDAYYLFVTHEYVIAVNGAIRPAASGHGTGATSIGWAADAVLAVGSDAEVASISRGDSTFLDLDGSIVTALPVDIDAAIAASREPDPDIFGLLVRRDLLGEDAVLEPGSVANLAFWRPRSAADTSNEEVEVGLARLRATVRGGTFTAGDERRGPFLPPGADARSGVRRA
jgi:hypothetical protein